MDNQTTTRQLLEIYYKGFSENGNWERVIADDFEFVGGDMTIIEPLIGRQNYIDVIKRFSQVFTSMRVQEMIVQDNHACVIGRYDFRFLNGRKINGTVAELWAAKNGKLQTLTIYFDTLTFANNSQK